MFLQVLRCFSSLRSPHTPMYSAYDTAPFGAVGCPIRKSPDQSFLSSSPRLIAARHVLRRLQTPRHPPHALSNLTKPLDGLLRLNCIAQETSFEIELRSISFLFNCQRTEQPFKVKSLKLKVNPHVLLTFNFKLPTAHGVELKGFEPSTSSLQS